MADLASTGIMIYARLDNKPRQKYSLFDKLSLAVIGACEAAKKPHIFLTIANQYFQYINIHFDGTLNRHCTMIFAENQET